MHSLPTQEPLMHTDDRLADQIFNWRDEIKGKDKRNHTAYETKALADE